MLHQGVLPFLASVEMTLSIIMLTAENKREFPTNNYLYVLAGTVMPRYYSRLYV
jgi:hypothetical protein